MQPKIGDEPIRIGFNRSLPTRKEQQSHPDELEAVFNGQRHS
jgi:hypothetical protein